MEEINQPTMNNAGVFDFEADQIYRDCSDNPGNDDSDHGLGQHADSYALALDETIAAPQPFAIPTQIECIHPRTGNVAFIVRREYPGMVRNRRVHFCCQGIPGLFNERVLFVAQREGRGTYSIFNVYNDNSPQLLRQTFGREMSRYVGEVKRSAQHGQVHYALFCSNKNAESTPASITIYDKSSLSYPVVEGSPDRIAYSILQNHHSTKAEADQMAPPAAASSLDKIRNTAKHESIHALVSQLDDLILFQSKRRFTNQRGRSIHDNIQSIRAKYVGRSVVASKKNLILMNVDSGKSVLRMGRLNRNEFSVDCLPPYTPFQAFGFALAQLDAN
jgi:Tub family